MPILFEYTLHCLEDLVYTKELPNFPVSCYTLFYVVHLGLKGLLSRQSQKIIVT